MYCHVRKKQGATATLHDGSFVVGRGASCLVMTPQSTDPSKRYEVLERLGSGSYGYAYRITHSRKVYRGVDRATGRVVAIKMVELDMSNEELNAIQNEIRILSRIQCAYVTKMYDSFVKDTQLWIVMECCMGGSCADHARSAGLSEAHIAVILRDVLRALVYLHAEDLVHRDIKAANVLLYMDKNSTGVRLADFGVAGQLEAKAKRDRTFVGTPYWMSPEVIKQSGYNSKADIWSVGITAIELALGEPPYADLHPMKVVHLVPRNPPPELPPTYSSTFRDFVAQCLTRDPVKRPTAATMLTHKFIKRASNDTSILRPLAQRYKPKPHRSSAPPRAVDQSSPPPMWEFASLRH